MVPIFLTIIVESSAVRMNEEWSGGADVVKEAREGVI